MPQTNLVLVQVLRGDDGQKVFFAENRLSEKIHAGDRSFEFSDVFIRRVDVLIDPHISIHYDGNMGGDGCEFVRGSSQVEANWIPWLNASDSEFEVGDVLEIRLNRPVDVVSIQIVY